MYESTYHHDNDKPEHLLLSYRITYMVRLREVHCCHCCHDFFATHVHFLAVLCSHSSCLHWNITLWLPSRFVRLSLGEEAKTSLSWEGWK